MAEENIIEIESIELKQLHEGIEICLELSNGEYKYYTLGDSQKELFITKSNWQE